MPGLRDVRQDQAARAFERLGCLDRGTKKNYVMLLAPNGTLIALPGGVLKTGLLRAQIRRAGFSVAEFEAAL